MKQLLNRYATPFMTGLFLVSLVSGIALFFHVGGAVFHGMHEWLSMVLIIPFALHVWKNWRPMVSYLGRAPMAIALAGSLVVSLAFAWPSGDGAARGGPPQIAFARQIMANTTGDLAPLLGYTPDSLVERLKANGFNAADTNLALTEVAARSGKNEMDLVRAVMPSR